MTFPRRSPTREAAVSYLRALRENNREGFEHITTDEVIRKVPALSAGEAREALREVRGS